MSRFSEQSDLYVRYRPDYPQELYDFIFEHLEQRGRAWDCATGSGQVAKVLAKHFDEIIATDISKEQLSQAPQQPNITYQMAAAEDPGLPANHFDLITVGQAIHWFDFEQFYEVVRRVARPNALLAVFGYGMVRINPEVDLLIDDLYEESFGSYFNENRKYLDEGYRTIPFPFEEIASPDFSNTLAWDVDHLEGYFNSWSAVQRMKTEQHYNPVTDTMIQLREKLPENETVAVTFPMFLRLGRVAK